MQILLYEPQIAQNTGNVARSCAVTGTSLRLIRPLFEINESRIKRAGLDYWPLVDLELIEDERAFFDKHAKECVFFSSHATKLYTEFTYTSSTTLVFGSESKGLPPYIHSDYSHQLARLPMLDLEQARCLNLATCAGIALYEALRQTGFKGLTQNQIKK